MYKTIVGYVESARIVVLLAIITVFALAAMCTSAMAQMDGKVARHYFPVPPIPFVARIWVNDPESPCFWKSTQHNLIRAVFPIVFNKKFSSTMAMIGWAQENEIAQPVITNARVISTGTFLTCSAGISINGNQIEVKGPARRNQIRYIVQIHNWQRQLAAIKLVDDKFIKRDMKFYTSQNLPI